MLELPWKSLPSCPHSWAALRCEMLLRQAMTLLQLLLRVWELMSWQSGCPMIGLLSTGTEESPLR